MNYEKYIHYIFDAIIFGFIIASLAIFINVVNLWQTTLYFILLTLLIFVNIVIIYGSFIEPKLIKNNFFKLKFSTNPKNTIKICFIADLHVGPYKREKFIEKVTKRIEKIDPDIVLAAGDFIYYANKETKHLKAFLSITKKYPTYGVLGNHEYWLDMKGKFTTPDLEKAKKVQDALEQAGVKVLMDENKLVEINNTKFNLIGVNEILYQKTDIDKAFSKTSPEYPKIVLVHNPDFMLKNTKYAPNLVLSGHTHGGQIRLPFIGHIVKLPMKLSGKYCKGLHNIDGIPLIVTSGIGECGPRARLFCPPEIVVVEIDI